MFVHVRSQIVGVLIVVAPCALFVRWRAQRQEIDAIHEQISRAERAIAEQAVASTPAQRHTAAANARPVETATQEAEQRAAKIRAENRKYAALGERLRANPDARAYIEWQRHTDVLARWGDWLDVLALPPDKLSQLRTLLVTQQIARQNAWMTGAKTDASEDEIKALREDAVDIVAREVEALIGSEDAARLKRLQGGLGHRASAELLATTLADSGQPATVDQIRAIAEALGDTLGERSSPLDMAESFELTTEQKAAFLHGIGEAVSARQLELIRECLDSEERALAAFYRMEGLR